MLATNGFYLSGSDWKLIVCRDSVCNLGVVESCVMEDIFDCLNHFIIYDIL
jgi:hypothetical protein